MLFLFGKSVSPKFRPLLGLIVLVLGIALHQVILVAAGAVYFVATGYLLVRRAKRNVQ
jgi:hypothetical protein